MSFKISSAWRPSLGSPVHTDGRGLDIKELRLTWDGRREEAVFNNVNKDRDESPLAKKFTDTLWENRSNTGVNQVIQPWRWVNVKNEPKYTNDHPVNQLSKNLGKHKIETDHLNHLHVGVWNK